MRGMLARRVLELPRSEGGTRSLARRAKRAKDGRVRAMPSASPEITPAPAEGVDGAPPTSSAAAPAAARRVRPGARARPAPRTVARAKRAALALAPGLVVALPPLFWVWDATVRAALTTLGRDQGIFQYVAWAASRGDRLYRDVRDVNGPLVAAVHLVFLALGGRDEGTFRVLDLVVSGVVFAAFGAALPGLGAKLPRDRVVRAATRAGWAAAAWVVLSGQYLLYGYWDTAQREGFFDWFVLGANALLLVGLGAAHDGREAGARRALVAAGALSVATCFGKPTCALYVLLHLFVVAVDDAPGRRAARLRAFAFGGGLAVAATLGFLALYGDVAAYARIVLVDVPTTYRFIWPRAAVEILSMEGYAATAALALVTAALCTSLVVQRALPRRALAVALFPVAGLATMLLQAKGFPYHFHPVSAGTSAALLLGVVWLWERPPAASGDGGGRASRFVPALAASALAIKVAAPMPASPYVQALWLYAKARTPEERASRDYLVYFQTPDFYPWEMRQAAELLKARTSPTDRVQVYGMDPYVLFLAERLSATPYIYAYDLNDAAALAGGLLPAPKGLHPTPPQADAIRALRDAHEVDLLARLEAEPPAAFVFQDRAPLIVWQDAVQDFSDAVPSVAAWMGTRYHEVGGLETMHVWLRDDLLRDDER